MRAFVENGLAGCELALGLEAVTVVVDALRASANVASMFHYGTEKLLVVREVKQAFSEKERWADAVLVGERGGLKVPGFDLGNSPLQGPPAIPLRHVVFSSSNCSRCCVGVAPAPQAFLATTVNATATARVVLQACRRLGTENLVFVTAGLALNETRFTVEDHLASAAVMASLHTLGETVECANDRAAACRVLFDRGDQKTLTDWFTRCDNGRSLRKLGLGADVEFAARLDVFDIPIKIAELVDLADGSQGALLVRA